ncbi:hypothetical protein PLICBS_000046 [Purpureocillium lilacinum]|uniref:uncharacterized protein n=1 Tax=Purpureocillium lilacinum TaxID=33203 RepID=UPI002080A67E|nr:hypothetical protein PLICBS_000046 [Purpureocillium lilacinum]
MANEDHGHEIFDLLRDHPETDQFFDQSLLAIAITDFSKEMVTYFLDRLGENLMVTATMITEASRNCKFGPQIAETLLDRFANDIRINDDMILSIMEVNSKDFTDSSRQVHDVLELLFERLGPEFKVTERVLLGAARSEFEQGEAAVVFKLVLDRFSDTSPIPDDVIMAAAKNPNAWAAMPLLLGRRDPEICITEEILCAAIPNMWDSYSSLLHNAAKHSIRITEKALATAAKASDRDAFLQVLKAADTNIRITQGILLAAASNGNTNGTQIMWLLLRESMSADEVDTDILDEVLQGDKWGIMSVILKRRGATIRLSKDLVQRWISNERTPGKALKFLLQYKTAELDSILDIMSADERAEFVERRDQLFKRFARDSWEDIFRRQAK